MICRRRKLPRMYYILMRIDFMVPCYIFCCEKQMKRKIDHRIKKGKNLENQNRSEGNATINFMFSFYREIFLLNN